MLFHVLNRGVGRRTLFDKDDDFLAFEAIIRETLIVCPMRICSYCLMSNHWHFLLWPETDGALSAFMQKLTNTHVKRWKQHRHEVGWGHLYQGRFKSFPVQGDEYFYQVARYIERNALRASLVEKAEQWRWSSLWRRGRAVERFAPVLNSWPIPRPKLWREHVNEAQTESEVAAIRRSIQRVRSVLYRRNAAFLRFSGG